MTTRLASLVIVGALLVALVPASAWALCSADLQEKCCCEKSGGACPRPGPEKPQTASCCGSPQAPPPQAATTTSTSSAPVVESLLAGRTESGDPGDPATVRRLPHDLSAPEPTGVSLYTLHAALLI